MSTRTALTQAYISFTFVTKVREAKGVLVHMRVTLSRLGRAANANILGNDEAGNGSNFHRKAQYQAQTDEVETSLDGVDV